MKSSFLLIFLSIVSYWVSAYVIEWEAEGVDYITKRRKHESIRIERNLNVEQELDSYMAAGMKDVIGWFDYQALLALRVVSSYQLQSGVRGGVVEIGVHHGKSFVALCLLNSDAGSDAGAAIAIDVFGDQHLNVDASGEGDLDIFRETVRAWCKDSSDHPERLHIIQQDSRTLTSADILARSVTAATFAARRVRLFSIDGSHTAEATHADLTTAAQCIAPGGIIVLDDYFAEGWPGVSEGAQRFLLAQASGPSRIVPFFVGFNKVFLAHEEYAGSYLDAIAQGRDAIGDDTMQSKMQEMLGSPVLVLSEEVRCRKPKRSLLPGECLPNGYCRRAGGVVDGDGGGGGGEDDGAQAD